MLNATSNRIWISLGAIVFAATACTTEVVGNDPDDPSQGGSGGATTTTPSEGGSGGSGGPALDVTKNVDISECGGFQPLSGSGDSGEPQAPPPPYCDAEVLYWIYDAERQELTFNDSRVELNCCGDHAISVSRQGDTVTVTETDAPEGGAGRCDCLCVFDFGATAGPIEQGLVQVELVRHVTDGGTPFVAWQGSVDLSEGAGFAVVDTTPSYFCEPYDSAPSAS